MKKKHADGSKVVVRIPKTEYWLMFYLPNFCNTPSFFTKKNNPRYLELKEFSTSPKTAVKQRHIPLSGVLKNSIVQIDEDIELWIHGWIAQKQKFIIASLWVHTDWDWFHKNIHSDVFKDFEKQLYRGKTEYWVSSKKSHRIALEDELWWDICDEVKAFGKTL